MPEPARKAARLEAGGIAADRDWERGAVDLLSLFGDDAYCRGYQQRRKQLIAGGREASHV